jgi:hypothetical protein
VHYRLGQITLTEATERVAAGQPSTYRHALFGTGTDAKYPKCPRSACQFPQGLGPLSYPAKDIKNNDDDQDGPDYAYASIPVATTMAAKPATETAKHEDDQNDDWNSTS